MPLEKATLTNTVTQQDVEVLFNPEEYTVSRDNNFAQMAIPGLRAPLLQFVHGNMQTLQMELLVDTYEAHSSSSSRVNEAGQDVRLLTSKITGLMCINPETHAPPVVLFTWGSLSFTCVLAKVSERFILFRSDGTPVRARLQVTFNEYTNGDLEAKEVKRQTADFTKVRVVAQGETLSAIAASVYGNAALWRPIALANAVDNPRRLALGTKLRIPPLPFRDPATGEVIG